MDNLKTTIGLEIHVQLKTKSKMFCRCSNTTFRIDSIGYDAGGKNIDSYSNWEKPNMRVCPVCLGLPGSLPVANEEAIKMTIKTGLALNAAIPQIAKFDRKHYFYPDLPKGYQISQYDEPFCRGGYIEVDNQKINFNRVHLEEDAGKLIHSNGKSLVDLNRAGTPLMEMVTEPDITSPKMAGDFLRRLQKLVRDEVGVSDADMEKGHLRCDANISVSDGNVEGGEWKVKRMSEIVEIKNINSFRFVEKALAIEEERLKSEYPNWPSRQTKVTRGYDSKKNITFVQRTKEEAADYRYFPEPDLPPFDTTKYNIEALRAGIGRSLESKIAELETAGVASADAKVLINNKNKSDFFNQLLVKIDKKNIALFSRAIVHNYFNFIFSDQDFDRSDDYLSAISALANGKISKANFSEIADLIHAGMGYTEALGKTGGGQMEDEGAVADIIDQILVNNSNEVAAYKAGKTQLFGFFVGQVMKGTGGRANPKVVNEILRKKLSET